MKRLISIIILALSGLLAANAQTAPISLQVISQYGQPVPFAQIRICSVTSSGTPCTPLTPIFEDYNQVHASPNPATADQFGDLTVYVPAIPSPNLYLVQVTPQAGTTYDFVYAGPASGSGTGCVTTTAGVFVYGDGFGGCAQGYIDFAVTVPNTLTLAAPNVQVGTSIGQVSLNTTDPTTLLGNGSPLCTVANGLCPGVVVQVNGTPISPSTPVNFVDSATVTVLATANSISFTASGGGSGSIPAVPLIFVSGAQQSSNQVLGGHVSPIAITVPADCTNIGATTVPVNWTSGAPTLPTASTTDTFYFLDFGPYTAPTTPTKLCTVQWTSGNSAGSVVTAGSASPGGTIAINDLVAFVAAGAVDASLINPSIAVYGTTPGAGGGGGGSTNVTVNGGSVLANLNLNGSSPSADTNFLASTFKIAGANAIAEVPYGTSSSPGVLQCGPGTSCLNGVLSVSSSGFTVQTNNTNNSSQSLLNFSTSTANSVGLTVTPVNPGGGVERFEITGGSYTGTAAGLAGGALGSVPYQTTASVTGFVASPTVNGHQFFFGWTPTGSAIVPTAVDLGTYLGANITAAAPLVATPTPLGLALTCPSCAGGTTSQWSSLINPVSSLALSMAAWSSKFTSNATLGTNDIWEYTDTASDTGTGKFFHIHTQSGSTEIPFCADNNGVGWCIEPDGSFKSVGSTQAGTIAFTQGTAPGSLPSNSVVWYSPTTIASSYGLIWPSSAPTSSNGLLNCAGSSTPFTCVWSAGGSASVVGSAEVVSFSSTPTFSSSFNASRIVLTGNITSFAMGGSPADGQSKTLCFKQGAGPFTVAPPAAVHGFFTVGTISGDWNCQEFAWDNTDSIWTATGPGVTNE